MSLLISIKNAPDSIIETSKSFGSQGGTIGRGPDNTWVLEDPERYLSACHCQISQENGRFFITDLSTNGTFYNGSPNPIGKGAKLALNEGDSFIIGDYEFSVSLSAADQSHDPLAGQYSDPFADNQHSAGFGANDGFASPLGLSSDPFASGHAMDNDPLFANSPAETDPLAALDKAQGKQNNPVGFESNDDPFAPTAGNDPFANAGFSSPTFADQADPLNQQISWPEATPEQPFQANSAIPDDWDDDLGLSSPAPAPAPAVKPSIPLTTPPQIPKPARAASNTGALTSEFESAGSQQDLLVQSNAKIQAELDSLKQQINAQQRGHNNEISVDTSLIESLGLLNKNLTDEQVLKINQLAGEVMREMVKGLMQVLGSRGSIKNEFRMHVTTIQPVENNPIKFSANVDDALENMFVKQGNAYKQPVEAVQEGFDSIAEHQVAILAGIKSAFKGVIERFDPVLLEERFARQNKGSFMPVGQKAKYWDFFTDYFNELAGDVDNSFQYLFGDDFVKAYEEQLQKMTIAKKAKKSNRGK